MHCNDEEVEQEMKQREGEGESRGRLELSHAVATVVRVDLPVGITGNC